MRVVPGVSMSTSWLSWPWRNERASGPDTCTKSRGTRHHVIPLRLLLARRGHASRRRHRGEQRGRLVAALEVLVVRIAVGDDAGTGLHRRAAVVDDHRADGDGGVDVAGEVEVTDGPGVRPALGRL